MGCAQSLKERVIFKCGTQFRQFVFAGMISFLWALDCHNVLCAVLKLVFFPVIKYGNYIHTPLELSKDWLFLPVANLLLIEFYIRML